MLPKTFLQRIGYHWPCVAPDAILTNDICTEEDGSSPPGLREEASRDGLTYLQVINYLPHADLYLARVANDPTSLGEGELLAFFTEAQLINTLPWDVRLQQKRPREITVAIRTHAATLQPLCKPEPVIEPASQPTELDFSSMALRPLPETIEITRDELHEAMQATVVEQQEAVRCAGVSPTEAAHLIQQALLLAALDRLMDRLWQTPEQARSLVAQARCKLLALLRRWQQQTRQRIVNAAVHWNQARECVTWKLTIGVPIQLGQSAS